jgi:PX-associated
MVSSPPPSTDHNPYELTPIRAHYLKKSLIQLQFSREIQAITSNASTLSYLGAPFSPPPKDAPVIDLPFLRYLFRQFVLTFPFLASAPKDFFPDKVQPFISSLLSRNLNSTSILDDESTDSASTAKLIAKAERSFSLFLNYAVKTVEKEETVRLSQTDLDKLEAIASKRHAKLMKSKDVFEVNVVCVRTVVDRGRVRSKVHEVCSHVFVCRPSTLTAPVCRSLLFVPGGHITRTCTFPVDMATSKRYIMRCVPYLAIALSH